MSFSNRAAKASSNLAASPIRFHVPDEDASFFDVAQVAAAEQMFVVQNGKQVIVCSIVPVGWKKVWVSLKKGEARKRGNKVAALSLPALKSRVSRANG